LEPELKATAVCTGLDHRERCRIPLGWNLDKRGETGCDLIVHAARAQPPCDPLRQGVGRVGVG